MKAIESFLAWAFVLLFTSPVEIDGAGRVLIGYPSFISGVDTQSEYVFSANDVDGPLPVYIQAFDDTAPDVSVPITDNVLVTCELSTVAGGFSSAVFTSVSLSAATNFTDITVSTFQPGRPVDVRCFGVSQIPPPVGNTTAPRPQFTKDGSLSLPAPFLVKPSPTVSFCEDVFRVPDRLNVSRSTFQLEFSELVEGGVDNVNVACTVSPIPGSPVPVLDIDIDTASAAPPNTPRNVSFVLLEIPFTIRAKGSAVSVQCSADSITGNQYRFSTSAGTPSQFEMETGSVHLYPAFPDFIQSTSPLIKTVVSLDSPVAAEDNQVTFLCQATLENDTEAAIRKTETPDCSFTTDTLTTTLAPTTGDANSTAPPVVNRSLWEVIPSTIQIEVGRIFRSMEILRTVDVNQTELELVLVTCCVPPELNDSPRYSNQSVALLTTAYLQPPLTDFSLGTAADQAFEERKYENPAYVEVAPCACDLTGNTCDTDCCCDSDCSDDNKDAFSECIPGLRGGKSGPNPTHFCNSTHVNKDDWFPLMCVEFQSSAVLGLFFENEGSARTIQSFNEKLASAKTSYSFREHSARVPSESEVGVAGYKYGQRVKTAQPTVTGGLSARSGILSLPQPSISGQCLTTAPVRFLRDLQSQCTSDMTPELCTPDSVLSARMYAEGSDLTNPPCPRTYQVLSVEDSSGKAVSQAESNYFCSPDNTGFLNTPDTMSRPLDPFARSLFDYTMPDESCQDMFGNDNCSNPAVIQDTPQPELPRCLFDDGYSPAPLPVYDNTSKTCRNAVLSVLYNFTWSGQRIVFLNTTVVLGDLPMDVIWQENVTITYTDSTGAVQEDTTLVDRSAPARVTQKYTAVFHHNYTYLGSQSGTAQGAERVDRSGYPGYDTGKPVHSGRAIVNITTDTFEYINSNLTNQMTIFQTGVDGLCFSAGRRRILFREDVTSQCALRLSLEELDNCTDLRKLVLNRLNNMMSADRVGRFGFLNSNNSGFWVPVIRQDLTDYFAVIAGANNTLDPPRNETNFTLIDDLRGVCNLTTGIHLDVLYAETGKTLGASILEIVGAKISYTLGTWNLTCSGANSARCYGNDRATPDRKMVESFYLSTSVRFFRVPAQIPEDPPLFWKDYDASLCPQDACWPGLFYPLTDEYTGEVEFYTLAWAQVIVIVLIFYFMITWPWW